MLYHVRISPCSLREKSLQWATGTRAANEAEQSPFVTSFAFARRGKEVSVAAAFVPCFETLNKYTA